MADPSSVTKRRAAAPAGFFAAEAAGLTWLAQAEPAGGARVVRVLGHGADFITMRRLVQAPATNRGAADFGKALAVTHAAGADAFGVGPANGPGIAFIGRQELPLGAEQAWGAFYADLRLMPYARAAHQIGNLATAALEDIESVCDRLRSGEFDDGRPPARIHGDLWTGNVLWAAHGGVLIDPAAHGGHGQTDLAMLALFGCPELAAIESAYAEAAGLPADWRERTGLHQLHPLLVHAVTHSAAYGHEAARIARRYR